jgi:hypothetical protein
MAVEYIQWGRWATEAPPRAEMERRAAMLRDAFRALHPAPILFRVRVGGAKTRWFSMRMGRQEVEVTLHWWLLQWPRRVAQGTFTTLGRGKLEARFNSWIGDQAAAFHARAPEKTAALPIREPMGRHIDLRQRLTAVAVWLDEPAKVDEVAVGWGRRQKAGRRPSSIRLGSMNVATRTLTIHPVLDDPEIPAYVLDMVLWHELCHWVCPPLSRGASNRIHHPEFRRMEARFPLLAEANDWIERNISWLLRRSTHGRNT